MEPLQTPFQHHAHAAQDGSATVDVTSSPSAAERVTTVVGFSAGWAASTDSPAAQQPRSHSQSSLSAALVHQPLTPKLTRLRTTSPRHGRGREATQRPGQQLRRSSLVHAARPAAQLPFGAAGEGAAGARRASSSQFLPELLGGTGRPGGGLPRNHSACVDIPR